MCVCVLEVSSLDWPVGCRPDINDFLPLNCENCVVAQSTRLAVLATTVLYSRFS